MSFHPERVHILRMIESGTITPKEGARLLQALSSAGIPPQPAGVIPAVEEAARPHAGWLILVQAGVVITILSAALAFTAMTRWGYGFWFFCAWAFFAVGMLVILTGWYVRTARWLRVHIREDGPDGPRSVQFSLPLPLGVLTWGLRTFGNWTSQAGDAVVADLAGALEAAAAAGEPVRIDAGPPGGKRIEISIE